MTIMTRFCSLFLAAGWVLGVILVGISPPVKSWSLSLEGLTESEMDSIVKLRELVKEDLTHDYMSEDIYLLRWLIIKNWKVDQAARQLKENLQWRHSNNIDTILEEDWSKMQKQFPYNLNSSHQNQDGLPLLYFSIDQWDISKFSSMEGSLSKLGRYFSKMVEETDFKIREMRNQGQDVTQFNLLINMKGYTMQRHGCFRCMTFYSGLGQTMEAHYPGSADQLMIVNAPLIFESVYSYLKRGLSQKSRKSMTIYGQKTESWEVALQELIPKENFPQDLFR